MKPYLKNKLKAKGLGPCVQSPVGAEEGEKKRKERKEKGKMP
jgi:hypothetical protein